MNVLEALESVFFSEWRLVDEEPREKIKGLNHTGTTIGRK